MSRSFRNSDRQQHPYPQRNHSYNHQRDQWRNNPLNDLQDRIQALETRFNVLESKCQDIHNNPTTAALEEIKKRLALIEEKLAKDTPNMFSHQQRMDFSELSKLIGDVDELKKITNQYKDLINPTPKIDEKGESVLIKITPHSEFILDEENRAIVYVKSRIIGVGKQRKGAYGIWWSIGHKGNTTSVIEDVIAMDEDDINLHAFICAMETAIRYKMQRLCIISDSKNIIHKMIETLSQENKKEYQWKVLSSHPKDRQNLLLYAYDMSSWFYDIKWSYVDEPSKLPGMIDASKLIDNLLSS